MSDKKLNIGVVGAGGRGLWVLGHEFIRRVNDVRVLAFADPRDQKKLRSDVDWVISDVCENIGKVDYDIATFDNIDDLLAIKEIDVVFVATPDHLHADYAERVLDSGRDMIIEKPLATTPDDLNRIVTAEKRTGRKVFVGFCLRYNALHSRVKEIVAEGAIGRLCTISFQDYYAGGRGYFRGRNRFRKYSGGLLTEKACHSFDLMSWLFESYPKKVSCFGDVLVFKPNKEGATHCSECSITDTCPDYVHIKREDVYQQAGHGQSADLCVYNSEKDTDDTDVIILQYESGAMATYVECFYPPNTERRYSIIGTKGEVLASEEQGTIRMRILDDPQGWTEEKITYPPGSHRGSDPTMISAIIEYFRDDAPNDKVVGSDAGRRAVLTALAAIRSSDEGRVVKITEYFDGV